MTADWIKQQPAEPTWAEVRNHVLRNFGVDRTVEAVRRVPELTNAKAARAKAPVQQVLLAPRPTLRRMDELLAQVDRLGVEIVELRNENSALLARNLRLINGARTRHITEGELDRPLIPINRSPTFTPAERKLK